MGDLKELKDQTIKEIIKDDNSILLITDEGYAYQFYVPGERKEIHVIRIDY